MSADILEAADAAAWYASEHHRAAHDADALHGADARTSQAVPGSPGWWHRRRTVARLRRRARLAGRLAAQARANHDQLLQVLVQEVEHTGPDTVPPRTDAGAELLDRLYDALHAHHQALREAARHNDEAAAAPWWQPDRRELAQLRADYAAECMAAQWEYIQQVRAEVDHYVRRRLPR